MKWYRNLSIRAQLIGALVILLIGFVAITITYNRVLSVETNALHTAERLGDFEVLLEESHIALLDAQRLEEAFKSTRDLVHVDGHAKDMAELHKNIDKLNVDAPDEKERELLANISKSLKSYETTFEDEVASITEIGLNDNSGLLGEMHASAKDIQQVLGNVKEPQLVSALRLMRLHEKDYLRTESQDSYNSFVAEERNFERRVAASSLSRAQKKRITKDLNVYTKDMARIKQQIERRNQDSAKLKDAVHDMERNFDQMLVHTREIITETDEYATETAAFMTWLFVGVLVLTGGLIAGVFFVTQRRLSASLATLVNTMESITQGDYEARTRMVTSDELGTVGRQFDKLLDERVASLAQAEKENNQLNDSVIELLEAVSQLSDRDLTVKVPVAEDITGPVADSMNLMASETSRVLKDIRAIAGQVEEASNIVQEQSDKVSEVAATERKVVSATITKLEDSSKTMNHIAKLANTCNEISAKATTFTQNALDTVSNTANGMNEIRETIAETEKRIKRLGERSQEINTVVEIINSIAERTHVLALNASMQAAAAGEAGRGFAVVADEVQRLAESSRQSTSEIAALVNNIQSETSETMATMNKTIAQVVEGTELANQAGEKMQETQKTTAELAAAVDEIAKRSLIQAKSSNDVREQARLIDKSTEQTGSELESQAQHTHSLVGFSHKLVESVSVFKLPA